MRTLVVLFLTVPGCLHPVLASLPRLVVVLVFDQMRGDYLQRWSWLWEDGFRRLLTEGAVYTQCFYQHASTVTCSGHATIATGTAPQWHGISGNNLIPSCCRLLVRCTEDTAGQIFSGWLQVPTLGDYLRQHFPESRVVSISHKAQAAILMGGHSPTTVLWLDPAQGGLVSRPEFLQPKWLPEWNRNNTPQRYAGMTWTPALPASLAPPDSVPWEAPFPEGTRSFPHRIPSTDEAFWDGFLLSPYSAEWLFNAAQEAVTQEGLGTDSIPDILWLSISTTDFIGHHFGPDSREIVELYYYCDRLLGNFLRFLDSAVGRSRYLLVLTSDHGVAPIPELLSQHGPGAYPGIDAGRIGTEELTSFLHHRLLRAFGPWSGMAWFTLSPPLLLLHQEQITAAGFSPNTVRDSLYRWLLQYEGLGVVLPSSSLWEDTAGDSSIADTLRLLLHRAFPPQRAGDLLLYPKPFWIFGTEVPATHGTFYDYDRFVPLVFFGASIPASYSSETVSPEDIAPTLAALLHIPVPTATGRPLILMPSH